MERKLELKENDYKSLLEMLHTYEKNLKLNETNVSNTIKHMGYLETQENLIRELGETESKLFKNTKDVEANNKKLREYTQLKKIPTYYMKVI
ncbi:hypothetical protein BSK49_10875 [Paenibacillus odorifer]|uniref:hypothetical protein n=1 Tax=Paenibacillus odorifer TaxID=189426 RepID=UPI00096D0749|nr:hypothetical protein [Paenibacillus odorifer]OMD89862.1 hypothetical protein BSK49_10875 [Paenibacillus odorifer]OMD98742.1 hypothetical protein BSK64_27135 [Paenibacillus odorifer]